MSAPVPAAHPRPMADGSLVRTETASPGMCGPVSLFAGRVGDWTWDAVSALCGVDAYRAVDERGEPTYLSFYYYRIRGSRELHPTGIAFGDRLQVVSRVLDCGSESVLTVHRIRVDTGAAPEPLDPDAFYGGPRPGDLLVENFNRWITRTRQHSNRDLARASPVGFRHDHLPAPPPAHSPRLACANARRGSFLAEPPPDRWPAVRGFTADYPVEAGRDLNGVGLLYFASYFAIVDWALLRLWRHLGRGVRDYLDRVVLDQRVCYLGNADGDAVVRVRVDLWRKRDDQTDELVEVVLRDRRHGSLLAVCLLRVRAGAA
ncbi:LnmK family bifunctional acyltransferase/decarboxylase [Saccharothrix coeruleofusca]|uniref:LnmK N-terminal domain-containing protein n=1 Tax=Saccharothrix coeruleofusca TaxID=33919 RepID=A0A918AK45_9PSEU|nr:LnmK family bifunctional acyltransferase/decarboxylase [Saccharothrix coeruleofusca]MBP2336640.1 putative biosynthetic protein (TIGR04098 family) [Saccharothrix coeruleofusca]GGP51537.1 hypothetical protein GCM10010185_24450 [Saccharothrix coeruleofusca]GGP84885.1 hypothetical protein GCM10010185_68370 [Saccharothrix coeruleofusca]